MGEEVNGQTTYYGYICNTNQGNVYETPSVNARIITYGLRGKLVTVLQQSATWYKVKLDMDTGYIPKNFINLCDMTTKVGQLLYNARSRLMLKYKLGEEGPGRFDGPGFTKYCFGRIGLQIPRTAAEQAKFGTAPTGVKAGDVLFFSLSGRGIDHCAIVSDIATLLHCTERGNGVKEDVFDNTWRSRLTGIRRYI